MLEKIKSYISKKYGKTKKLGFFLSAFDTSDKLLCSHGVVFSDKTTEATLDLVYKALFKKFEKNIYSIKLDIILETKELKNIGKLNTINLKKNGICLIEKDSEKSGVLLPDTAGISSIPEAISKIKEKNNLKGETNILIFTTERVNIF